LRQIVKVLAIKQGVRANIEVADSQNQPIMGGETDGNMSDDMDVDVSKDEDDDILVPEASAEEETTEDEVVDAQETEEPAAPVEQSADDDK
jgi:hypothetical protein